MKDMMKKTEHLLKASDQMETNADAAFVQKK